MSRPISFRAWHSGRKIWLHDKSYGGCHILGETIWAFGEWCRVSVDELNDVVVTQFTGLKDSKGVDIYEGDLVKTNSTKTFAVEWGDGTVKYAHWCGWVLMATDKSCMWNLCGDLTTRVVGNIFENSDLIKP